MPTRLRTTALALFVMTAALLARPTAAQDLDTLLERLPESYDAAILVPNLAALDAGLASFESSAGLGLGELQDAVGRFKRELGLMRGIDDSGSMAIVIIEAGENPLAVMLLPVTDYDALAESLGAEPGDMLDVTLPGGATGVLRQMEGYAILGGNRQVVLAYDPTRDGSGFAPRFGARGARVAETSQLSVVLHTAEMDDAVATAELTRLAAVTLLHADTVLAPDFAPGKRMPFLTSVSGLLARGTDALVAGFTFSADGLDYIEAYRFADDDDTLAGLFLGQPEIAVASPDAVLAKLPDDPIIAAIAGDPKAVGMAELTDRFGGFLTHLGLDPRHALGTAKPQLAELFAQANGVATAIYAQPDPGQMTQRWLNTITVFEVEDERLFAESLEAAVLSLNDAEVPAGGAEPITFTTTYEAEDRVLGGVRYDTFKVQVHVPMSLRGKPMMLALAGLGEIGFTGQAAVIDGHVVVTTFDDLGTITRAIETVASGNGLGTGGAMQQLASQRMPEGRAVVGFLDLAGVADTLAPFLAIAGDPDPASVEPGTEPIVFAINADVSEASVHLFFPSSAVYAMVLEDFEPSLQRDDSASDNGGRGADSGRSNRGGNAQPGRNTQPLGPGSQPGRGNPGRESTPGRGPGRGPGRPPR